VASPPPCFDARHTSKGIPVTHDLVLQNALAVAPSGVFRGGIAIDGGEIVALGASSMLGRGRRETDLDGKIVLPGLFDPHVYFGVSDRIGEESMVEDFPVCTKDCLVGGVTTIATTSLLGRRPNGRDRSRTLAW
jgi:dihydropyrimidinase